MLVADINLTKLRDNITRLKGEIGDANFCAVVKADAYGHGMKRISISANELVQEFAVATFDEALELCSYGITKPINLLSNVDRSWIDKRRSRTFPQNIIPAICDIGEVEYLNKDIKNVNIKLNTGMNRIGVRPQNLRKLISDLKKKGYNIKSIYTHFFNPKCPIDTAKQFYEYQRCILPYKSCGFSFHISSSNFLHLSNTMPDILQMNTVRFGLAMYGYSEITTPIMEVYTNILQVFNVKKGEHISYGNYLAPYDCKIAAIRVGYADGYRRKDLESLREVEINGVRCPVMGQVCMDITLVDVSKTRLKGNDKVFLIGRQIKMEDLMNSYQTIPYEILTSFGPRLKRNYIK
ncbi:MAG: alanine racemase [Firmicutes bacterium]|nr:alanine racemase [Bacillota bacterium]